MTWQLNHLIAKQRQIELADRAEQARLAYDARVASLAPSRRWNRGRLLTPRRIRAAGLAAAARPARPRPPQECVRCDT